MKRDKSGFFDGFYSSLWFWGGLLGVFFFAAWLNWIYAGSVPLTFDEYTHLMWLRLINAGYEPYAEIYISLPPLFPLFLAGSWAVWPSLGGLCWAIFAYAFLSAVALALIARRMSGPLAGVAAAFLLAVTFGPCEILAEEVSITGSLFALWLAMVYRDRGRRWLLVLSAGGMAISLLTKPQSPFMLPLVGLVLLSGAVHPEKQPKFQGRQLVIDLLLWGGTMAAICLLVASFFDLQSLFTQAIGQHVYGKEAYEDLVDYWPSRITRFLDFFDDQPWLFPLALLGFIQTFLFKTKDRYVMLAWFLLAALTLTVHEPIRYKHFVIFLPPLCLWAGLAVAQTAYGFACFKTASWPARSTALLGGGLIIASLLMFLPGFMTDVQAAAPVDNISADTQTKLDFISQVTLPEDCLLTDDLALAYWSGRLVPPPLAEISSKRFRSGYLTLADLVAIGARYNCPIAAPANRIARFTPDFKDWAGANYLGRYYYGENEFLYVGKARNQANLAQVRPVTLGNTVQFLGYTLDPAVPQVREPLSLTTYWKVIATTKIDYTVFVQLRNQQNTTLVGADHQPFNGAVPTSHWKPGVVIRDVIHLDLPSDLSPGAYRLAVGMYRLDTMQRLPVQNDTSGENAVMLNPINIGG